MNHENYYFFISLMTGVEFNIYFKEIEQSNIRSLR